MRIALIITALLIFSSCNKTTIEKNEVKANSKMAKVLDSLSNLIDCSDCVNEIYIDKQDPHNYMTIVYSGKQSLTGKENMDANQLPINFVKTSTGVSFNIYTGIEHYFHNPNDSSKVVEVKQYDNSKTKIWTVKDSLGYLKIDRVENAYPFMPLPKEIDITKLLKKSQ